MDIINFVNIFINYWKSQNYFPKYNMIDKINGRKFYQSKIAIDKMLLKNIEQSKSPLLSFNSSFLPKFRYNSYKEYYRNYNKRFLILNNERQPKFEWYEF